MFDESSCSENRILVTGASGFIGRRLIEVLSSNDTYIVTALVRNARNQGMTNIEGVSTVIADMSNRQSINQVVKGHEIVVNLAYDFKRSQRNNLNSFSNLHDACVEHGVKRFVQVSSIVVYDDWPNEDVNEKSSSNKSGAEYRDAKISIEQILQKSSSEGLLDTIILQPTIVYGPHSWLWTDAIVEKLLTGKIILPRTKGVCNAVYVDDVVDALLLAIKNQGDTGEKYIISASEPIQWSQFFESYNQVLGTKSIQYADFETSSTERSGYIGRIKKIIANPLVLANWGPIRFFLNVIERFLGNGGVEKLKLFVTKLKKSSGTIVYYPNEDEVKLYCSSGVCSIAKAKEMLAYHPSNDFNSGFKKTAQYITEKYNTKTVSIDEDQSSKL